MSISAFSVRAASAAASIRRMNPNSSARRLQQSGCRVLFVENEEQLDKVLLVREACPALQRIVIFDMKGLRDFADPICESFQSFVARGTGPPGRPISRPSLPTSLRCCCFRTPACPARAAC